MKESKEVKKERRSGRKGSIKEKDVKTEKGLNGKEL